jgi:hypothetical protein
MSMMTHPMHLHGHHFQVAAINGQPFAGALRDTVIVPHMNSVTFAFEAINSGKAWAVSLPSPLPYGDWYDGDDRLRRSLTMLRCLLCPHGLIVQGVEIVLSG